MTNKMEHCEGCICKTEKQFNGLICNSIEQFNVAFKDIVIPKGWRLPTAQEGIELVNNADFVRWSDFDDSDHDFYVQQPFKRNEGKWAAWLGCYDNYFYLNGDDSPDSGSAGRGVLLIRDIKEE